MKWWETNPDVLCSSAIALCFSISEYACPVWTRSAHVHKLDTTLNDTCRLITGCLKFTKTKQLYMQAGIAPAQIRQTTTFMAECEKQCSSPKPTKIKKKFHSFSQHSHRIMTNFCVPIVCLAMWMFSLFICLLYIQTIRPSLLILYLLIIFRCIL